MGVRVGSIVAVHPAHEAAVAQSRSRVDVCDALSVRVQARYRSMRSAACRLGCGRPGLELRWSVIVCASGALQHRRSNAPRSVNGHGSQM
eukprot:3725406-Rhodomonas_salina.2